MLEATNYTTRELALSNILTNQRNDIVQLWAVFNARAGFPLSDESPDVEAAAYSDARDLIDKLFQLSDEEKGYCTRLV